MSNNYSEQIFQSIDTIISQRLNEVSFDKTEICKIVNQNKDYPNRYQVTNEAGLKYEAYSSDDNKKYLEGQKVYVIVPQGNYELRKLIIGSYSTDEIPKNLYVNPFNHLATSSTLSLPNSIWAKVNDEEYDEWEDMPPNETKPNSVEFPVEFKYKNIQDFDYIGLDFSFNTNIVGYQGSYALKISLWNGETDLTKDDNTLILSSKNLYGNPYNLNDSLSFQHLFPWPTRKKDNKIEPIPINEITKIKLQLIQDNEFLKQQGEINVNTDTWIELTKADLKFGYDVKNITKDELQLILEEEQSLKYTTEETAAARTLYLDWKHFDTFNNLYIFNINQLPNIFEYYKVYWLHYVDGLGENEDLPNEYAWNWETITNNTDLKQDIILTTLYRTDQYKVVIEYKYKNNETVYYSESTGLVFDNINVAAEPGASNSSQESLRIKLDENDTGVYNIYGLDGRMTDSSYRGPHNIHFEFLDATPLNKIASINWEFPSENTMIKDVADIDKEQATFNIDTMYKPGAMNNRIWCTVTLVTGEIRRGSLTLQFGEAVAAGSNYAFNIDFIGHRTCLYATGKEDSVEIQAIFTKQNGEVMTVPTIMWSWMNDYNSPITLSSSTGEKITLTYNNSEVPEENYSILQAEISDYAIDNGLTTNLTAYLPIPIAKPEYNYISGATRVVYDSNGNSATYSKIPYELYNLTNKIKDTSWNIISNSINDTFQLKTQSIRDKNGNIIGEEKTLLPLSYIPQEPPMTCIYCILNENIVWSQPILIIQNRWEYDLLNEWNGQLKSDGENYVLAPLLGAGKKEGDNGFTGVLMGDLRTAEGQLSETGLYGFKEGSRRFSFNDKGEAYIGTGDYYIDFNNENLKISTKLFDLKSEHIEINENGLTVNNGGNFIVKDKNNIARLFFDGSTGYLTLRGAIKGSGSDYCEIGTDSNNYNGFYYHHPKRSSSREVFKIWPGYSNSEYSRMVISSDNGIAFSRTITPNVTNADGTQSYTHTLIIDYNNSYMYGKWNLGNDQYFTGDIKTPNSFIICRSSTSIDTYDLHLWADNSYNGVIDAPNANLSLRSKNHSFITGTNTGGTLHGIWDINTICIGNGVKKPVFRVDITDIAYLSWKDSTYLGLTIDYGTGFAILHDNGNGTSSYKFRTNNEGGELLGAWDINTITSSYTIDITSTQGNIKLKPNSSSYGWLYGNWYIDQDYNGSGSAVTSDINKKNSILDIENRYEVFFNTLHPVTFKYNNGNSDRIHVGYIAQEVGNALGKANLTTQEFAGLVITTENVGDFSNTWMLRYEEFIALNTWQIQKLKTRVTELENEIKEIKQHYEI